MPTESNDRRILPRVPAIFAVELSSQAKPARCGVSRNASETGLLVVTPSRFAGGDRLAVSVLVGSTQTARAGRVVRVDENPVTSHELWRYRLAIELDEPLPADVLAQAEQLARSGAAA